MSGTFCLFFVQYLSAVDLLSNSAVSECVFTFTHQIPSGISESVPLRSYPELLGLFYS